MGYHQQLLSSDIGMGWHHDRGIDDSSINRFNLGWVTEPLSHEVMGLEEHPLIPYMTLMGDVIELKVRKHQGKQKYLRVGHQFPIPMSKKVHLFNAKHAMPSPRSRRVYVVEGEYDCMIAVQAGLRAVGVAGVTNFNPVWCSLFASSEVCIVFDGDDAGARGAGALASEFSRRRIDASVLPLPGGTDITDLWLQGGRDLVRVTLRGD